MSAHIIELCVQPPCCCKDQCNWKVVFLLWHLQASAAEDCFSDLRFSTLSDQKAATVKCSGSFVMRQHVCFAAAADTKLCPWLCCATFSWNRWKNEEHVCYASSSQEVFHHSKVRRNLVLPWFHFFVFLLALSDVSLCQVLITRYPCEEAGCTLSKCLKSAVISACKPLGGTQTILEHEWFIPCNLFM